MPNSNRVSSAESTSSVASTSSQRLASLPRDGGHDYATTASVTTSYGRHLSDICAILIHCPKHEKFALVPCSHRRGLWLPYVALKQSEGWYAAVVNKLRQLLNVKIVTKSHTVFTQPELMHVLRIQLPGVLKYVNRQVFMTNLMSLPVSSPSSANSSALHRDASAKASASATQNGQAGHPKANRSAGSHESHSASPKASPSTGAFKCFCESKEHVNSMRWLTHEAIVTDEDLLEIWGPEPAIFTSAFATHSVERGAYSEYTLREAVKFQPREPARTYQEEMLRSCHFDSGDILRLYSDYLQHCFPSQHMNFTSFKDYLLKLGYEPQSSSGGSNSAGRGSLGVNTNSSAGLSGVNMHDFRALFRAFKVNLKPYVTFHELLLGLAAMDRSTAHGGQSGELRCSYIFRYYDTNGDGKLDSSELKVMAADRIRLLNLKAAQANLAKVANQENSNGKSTSVGANSKSRSTSSSQKSMAAAMATASTHRPDNEAVSRELAKIYQMLKLKPSDLINEMNFLLAVGSMQLRGTSILFRSQVSVLPVKQHYETIAERQALTDIEGNLVGTELQRKGTCPRCREKKYVLALHTVKLTREAQIVEPTEVRFDEYPPPISRAQRQLSRAVFASDSTPNRLIDMIGGFWDSLVVSQAANSQTGSSTRLSPGLAGAAPMGKTVWERTNRQHLAEDIRRVCSQAEQIFKHENRVVSVTSPCYVLGDIHGNLNDLRTYERILWPCAPTCVSGSYLFLGDYVDRGDFGLECICYLLSMKVLAPKTFYLLRGNHELRSIQQAFTFFREVCDKFRSQQLGIQVWETLNKVFDLMPVAATIDDQIFCSHGGIPTSAIRMDELHNIPVPMADPENQSQPAWEILWNDPVSSTEFSEYADLLRRQPGGQQAVINMQGYLPNTKRGTAFFFSEEAVKRFLHINNLSHIIRAHECVPPGYALHCNGKVITIFSSSHYCGATNNSACILVEREKIRIIRLDTD